MKSQATPSLNSAYAPAKLILTGEYSVMYGKPAVALPVLQPKLGVKATWHQIQSTKPCIKIIINPLQENKHWQTSWQQIQTNYQQIEKNWMDFTHQPKQSKNVKEYALSVEKFIDCAIFLALHARTSSLNTSPNHCAKNAYQLEINSNIPLGSGLGSSAATVTAILQAINPELNNAQCFTLACKSEDFAHGKSGLLDPWITVYQQACYWQNRQATPIQLQALNYCLVHTGTPQSSTARCVQQVKQQFPPSHLIWQEMAKISEAIAQLIQVDDEKNATKNNTQTAQKLHKLIHQNHQLLLQIGVVPEPVNAFIRASEQLGLAAKTTGAGAIVGKNGGVVIVFYAPTKHAEENLASLASLVKRYDYRVLQSF